ncbi:hypothetical protein J1N35_040325 [Gossypium stocksii]|uniref:RNase H type-1 domain-containing protein n=1 Tax=Gossypium stocksii TaxID=47602 RepID=A0A9D3UDC3_9ROSI|nr:hypothetical protein J1N35_040325 [Gossypium stocksii]
MDAARVLDKKALSDFVTVLWNIWNSRNNKVFRNEEEEARVTWERAAVLSHEFRIFNLLETPMLPKPTVVKVWKKPGHGSVKINIDAATSERKMSFGIVARDHDGFVLGGRAGVLEKKVQAEWAELYTLEECMKFAQTKRWPKLEIETDCVSLVNRINGKSVDFSTIGFRIKEIFNLVQWDCIVSFFGPHVVVIRLRMAFVNGLWLIIVIRILIWITRWKSMILS